jgi:transposase
MYVLDVKV